MARQERNDVDYFPHPVNHGKKMHFIETKYKNDGYATWMKILEELGSAQYHFLDLKDGVGVMFLSSKCCVSEIVLLNIINDLIRLGEFDEELWVNEKILFNQKFIDNIQDAYAKRNNKCIDKKSLLLLLYAKGRIIPPKSTPNQALSTLNYSDNTQRIVKDSIVKEIKEKENFEKFRKIYPGTKKGLDTEFENFCKKHKDWKEVIPMLEESIKNQMAVRQKKMASGEFVPEWKHLQTWINQRDWEVETNIERIKTANDFQDRSSYLRYCSENKITPEELV